MSSLLRLSYLRVTKLENEQTHRLPLTWVSSLYFLTLLLSQAASNSNNNLELISAVVTRQNQLEGQLINLHYWAGPLLSFEQLLPSASPVLAESWQRGQTTSPAYALGLARAFPSPLCTGGHTFSRNSQLWLAIKISWGSFEQMLTPGPTLWLRFDVSRSRFRLQNFSHSSPGNGSMHLDLWATALQYTWFCHFLCYTIFEKKLLHLENNSNIFLPSLVSIRHWNSISNIKPIFFMCKYGIYNLVRNDDYESCHEKVKSHEFPWQNIINKCKMIFIFYPNVILKWFIIWFSSQLIHYWSKLSVNQISFII